MSAVSKSHQKFSKDLHALLQRIIYEELNDSIFRRVGINYLKLNAKKTYVTVYLDIENVDKNEDIFHKLKLLTPFFRRKLAEKLGVYKIPYLNFVNDEAFTQALKVEALIDLGLQPQIKKTK